MSHALVLITCLVRCLEKAMAMMVGKVMAMMVGKVMCIIYLCICAFPSYASLHDKATIARKVMRSPKEKARQGSIPHRTGITIMKTSSEDTSIEVVLLTRCCMACAFA